MKQKYLQDQRGVGLIVELVLVAAVLTLAGLAVFQADHKSKLASVASTSATASNMPVTSVGVTPSTPVGLAASAAAISEQDAATDASLSASADNSATQLTQTDNDVTSLQGSSNANF